MGAMALAGMLEAAGDIDVALRWHLGSNHFPPIPEVFDAAKAAIDAGNDGDYDRLIELPEGVSWRGQTSAPAHECIGGWHLEAFLS
jgi:hypothetical protein